MSLWRALGVISYWVGWPVFWFYLRGSQRARVLLVAEDKILVVKTWLGDSKWSLPGGGLHDGEDPKLCAIRELAEETNIELKTGQLQLMAAEPCRAHGHTFDCHYFLANIDEDLPTRPQFWEILEAKWMMRDQLNAKNAAADVLRGLELWKS
jgi:ADP-ribose pyrophosphatase YjhB (NUDIX family)